jgi:hypothetical protein
LKLSNTYVDITPDLRKKLSALTSPENYTVEKISDYTPVDSSSHEVTAGN